MTRAEAQKAIDAAFADVLISEYRNILMVDLAVDKPDRAAADRQFRKALAVNLDAHALASRAAVESPDLKD